MALLHDIAACSTQVSVVQRDGCRARRRRSCHRREGEAPRVRFAGDAAGP
jgi:hypothetical protein